MKVSLIAPPFNDTRDRSAYYTAPPLGLLFIASYLEDIGCEVTISDFIFEIKTKRLALDKDIYKTSAAQILESSPDVVCFSTQCTTGPGSVNIAKRIKELNPEVIVVLGGHDVSFIAEEFMTAFDCIDFILAGEGELTLPKLIEFLDSSKGSPEEIEGLYWRQKDGQIGFSSKRLFINNLNTVLEPAYHLVPDMDEYFEISERSTILVDSGRGCAYSCEFCQTTLMSEGKVRYKSVECLINELKMNRERYGHHEAYFVHDLFNANRKFVEDFCQALIKENIDITWQCRARADLMTFELLSLMKQAGCRMLLYGIESGDEETLAQMNKKGKKNYSEFIFDQVTNTIDVGIFPSLSMVIGIPEETMKGLNATMELASRFIRMGSVNAFIQLMSPLPGTVLANRIRDRFEYLGQSAPSAFNQGIEFDNGRRLEEDEELIKNYPSLFQSFYSVIPDHGNMQLCIDITLAYCKLLEVFQRSYSLICSACGITHLELFIQWREFSLKQRKTANLYAIKDFEIWNYYMAFMNDVLENREFEAATDLKEVFEFDLVFHQMSVATPIDHISESIDQIDLNRIKLKPSVALIKTKKADKMGLKKKVTGDNLNYYVLFGTQERIKYLAIDELQFDILEGVNEGVFRDNKISKQSESTLCSVLSPFLDAHLLMQA